MYVDVLIVNIAAVGLRRRGTESSNNSITLLRSDECSLFSTAKNNKIKNRAKARANNKTSNGKSGIPHPPQFNSTIMINRKARFQYGNTASGTLSLTRAMLLNHLVVANSATSVVRILSGFRLKSITLWAVQNSTSASFQFLPETVSVEWTSNYGPSVIVSDTSMSVQPAYVQTSPPSNSLASFWSLTGSNESEVIALISGVYGMIIDITYDCILQNGETPVAITQTTASVNATVYMSYLDGLAGNGYYVPISYKGIF